MSKTNRDLKIDFIAPATTIIDTVNALIEAKKAWGT